ncbi:MAG: hypothetical protein IJU71_12535 [Selenomonadaceae bacterium]|nr:hypothetical protein [Selenomonadaceae bacterium]
MYDVLQQSMVIYRITIFPSGKVYVGQTTRPIIARLREHLHAKSYVGKALRKSRGLFSVDVLEECATLDELNKRDSYWIATLGSHDKNRGCNLTDGGGGRLGRPHSAETKRKLSEAKRGPKNPNYGKPHSPEQNAKIAASMRGKMVGAKSPWYGCHHTAETRARMSESHKGANSPNYGKPLSAEQRRIISEANSIGVVCVETGMEYHSMTEAAAAVGVCKTTISRACRDGRAVRGLHFARR